METDLRYRVLKKLIIEYQDNQDSIIFEQILKRIDGLLVYAIKRFLTGKKMLFQYDAQELYHAAVVGAYHAVEMVKEHEEGGIIASRIVADVENELNKLYKETVKSDIIPYLNAVTPQCADEATVYRELESEFLQKKLQSLIDLHIITDEELKIFKLRYIEEFTVTAIAKRYGRSRPYITGLLKKTKRILRRELEDDV